MPSNFYSCVPNGDFISCHVTHHTGQSCVEGKRAYISREKNAISRHYGKCHAQWYERNGRRVPYDRCALVSRAAAVALVGEAVVSREEGRVAGATERATSVPRDPNWAPDDESEDEDDEEMVVEQEEEPMAPRAIRLRFQRLEVAMGEAYVRIAKLEEEVEELNAQLNVQSAVAESAPAADSDEEYVEDEEEEASEDVNMDDS